MPFFNGAGGRVYFRNWKLSAPQAVALFLHGAGEHSGHYHRLAGALNSAGIELWSLDHLGHGLSNGAPGAIGSVPDLATNAAHLLQMIRAERPGLPVILAGHSLGGVTCGYMLTRGEIDFAGVVLAGTPLKPGPILSPPDLVVTRDPFYIDMLETDPLTRPIPPELVADRRRLMAEVRDDMAERLCLLDLPILLINGTEDAIAPFQFAKELGNRLRQGRSIVHAGGCHDIINDSCYEQVHAEMIAFVQDCLR